MDGSNYEYALLQYRNVPLNDLDRSHAKLLMGQYLRTKLPFISHNEHANYEIHQNFLAHQEKQQWYHNRKSKPLKLLHSGDVVRLQTGRDQSQQGVVRYSAKKPRSYVVETENEAILRRNKRFNSDS